MLDVFNLAHGHSHGHSHSHGHGDSGGSFNIDGVFLHVLADTMGSVGVILSSLLIEYFGWYIADPICSFCIGSLIFVSVIPLVRSTGSILMLRTPEKLEDVERELEHLPGVKAVEDVHSWQLVQIRCVLLAIIEYEKF